MFQQQGFANQAVVHLFVGIGFALVNLILRYFAPWMPQIISVLARKNIKRALVAAYLIALVLQIVASLIFYNRLFGPYQELAWSPYEAIFNVLGVLAVDGAVRLYNGVRRGAQVGGQQLATVKAKVSEELDELGDRILPDEEAAATRQRQDADAAAKALTDRKGRMDDRLKDY